VPLAVPWAAATACNKRDADQDEDTGEDEPVQLETGIVVLYSVSTADEDQHDPGDIVEIAAKTYEYAYSDQQGVPAEQPVRQGEPQLIQEEYSTHEQEEKSCPDSTGSPGNWFVIHCVEF
jgi:hypothetical protein